MTEYERLHNVYRAAKQAYDAAERALASARFTLNYAERAQKREWDKLVAAAEVLPEEVRKRIADEQFGGGSRHVGQQRNG